MWTVKNNTPEFVAAHEFIGFSEDSMRNPLGRSVRDDLHRHNGVWVYIFITSVIAASFALMKLLCCTG
jgi:hypothetical protein